MKILFKALLIITALLLIEGCSVQYSTEHPMANNPRYKDQYSRIKHRRAQSPELVINGRKQPVYGSQTASNRPKQEVIDPNSPKALTFGRKATLAELAKAEGVTGQGGIRFGEIIVLPLEKPSKRYGSLHVKTILNGETIAKAHQRRSEVRIPFVEGQLLKAKMFPSYADTCKVLLDDAGDPITVRKDETGFHRYGFYNFLNQERNVYHGHKKQVKNWQAALTKEQTKLDILKNKLAKNRAYQNGQCVSVKQRAIPKAPKRIDPKLIELNAHGACVNLVGSQFTQEQVIEALEAAGRFDITQDYQKWVLGSNKMSCAVGVTIPEEESLITRAIDWLAPNLGKDYFRKAIRKDIDSCIYDVKSQCDDGYNDWLRERSRIINEPENLLKQCKQDKHSLATYDYRALNNAKARLAKATALRDAALSKKNSIDEKTLIPFTDKRTYCGE